MEANTTPALQFLYKIISRMLSPLNIHTENHYMLLCKAFFHSYDFQTQYLSKPSLEQFFNKNGFPHVDMLNPSLLDLKHEDWDGIEQVSLVCDGAGGIKKVIKFERFKGERRIKYIEVD